MKRLSILVAVVAWTLHATTVLATPGSGATSVILATATFDTVATNQAANRESVIQELTIAPGGHTGWHTHPGGVFVMVESGTFSMYHSDCSLMTVPAGRGLFEAGGQVQLARNDGAVPLVLTVVYLDIASPDGPLRADAATPACAAEAGLPTTAAGSLVTANVIIDRATFATAATITNGDERDVVVQSLTFAPGGHTGWHSHPGTTQVFVVSGTFSFYSATDCVRQNFTAGQGIIEPGGGVQLARNESTTEPLVLFVVYYDVPQDVAGGFRIDQPEPSTCTGLAGVPAPSAAALPNTAADVAGTSSTAPALAAMLVAMTALSGLTLVVARRRAR
ncbi:hypothetical protein BH20CHL8_BH20CHL8_07160 [soil metagenome]